MMLSLVQCQPRIFNSQLNVTLENRDLSQMNTGMFPQKAAK